MKFTCCRMAVREFHEIHLANFVKFACRADHNYRESNLAHHAAAVIKTLQHMGPSDPTNCASKVQIENLLYVLIPGMPDWKFFRILPV